MTRVAFTRLSEMAASHPDPETRAIAEELVLIRKRQRSMEASLHLANGEIVHPDDLRIDTWGVPGGAGPGGVRITHTPTGVCVLRQVGREGSLMEARQGALEDLERALNIMTSPPPSLD